MEQKVAKLTSQARIFEARTSEARNCQPLYGASLGSGEAERIARFDAGNFLGWPVEIEE